jgi:peptidoglycan/LPS O-acetylase OafA/YrhL
MTNTRPGATHKYKKGTTFVFFGLLLLAIALWAALTGNGGPSVLGLVGLVLLIIGIAKKREHN